VIGGYTIDLSGVPSAGVSRFGAKGVYLGLYMQASLTADLEGVVPA